ncbi:MAG: FAD-binding oxidoreductase [Deltaproteobacteria bacterium]|nr:FAD-binding oxidoreductase [Deltaproteobacteria bacterium]
MEQRLWIRTRRGGGIDLPLAEVEALAGSLGGQVLTPWHDGYEEARRLWNGLIEKRPALIARCSSPEDVAECLRFARARDLVLAVRGGGHNVAGHALCDGGLVIDLSPMRRVRVDPARRIAYAQGGATLGDVDEATVPHGLAVPLGLVSATGVSGLALHGGYGWMSRHAGLTADNLEGAELVLADGRRVRANERENPDLHWALRGGGGNFGVVTELALRAWPIASEVFMAVVFHPLDQAAGLLRFFRDFMLQAPREVGGLVTLWTTKDGPPFPPAWRAKPVAAIAAVSVGDPDEAERLLRPLREWGRPVVDLSARVGWLEAQRFFDEDYPDGRLYYWKALYLKDFGEPEIGTLARLAGERPSPLSSIDFWVLNGKAAEPAPDATAFARRTAPFMVAFESSWDDPEQTVRNIDWTRRAFQEVELFASGETYLNFPGFAEGGERFVRGAYGENWERLRRVKSRYDPENHLHGNFNIPPEP